VDSHLILQRDNSQVAPAEFGTGAPEAEAVVLSWFLANRVFNNANAPFFLEIWTFAKNLVLKIFGEAIFGHVVTGNVLLHRRETSKRSAAG